MITANKYSKFSSVSLKVIKDAYRILHKDTKESDPSLFFDAFKEYLVLLEDKKRKEAGQSPCDVFDKKMCNLLAWALHSWKYGTMTHYFIESGIADFAAHSVKNITNDYYKPFKVMNHAGSGSKLIECIALHFPTSENRRSLIVIPIAHKNGEYEIFFTDGVSYNLIEIAQDPDASYFDYDYLCKTVLGLSLYMDAFPDAIREAKCENVKHVGHYNGGGHVLSRNDVVLTEEKDSVSPHFRRGHFRVLSSERYTKKRGQVVFVKGTFVKGKAYEVLEDNDCLQ